MNIQLNGEPRDVAEQVTVATLLEQLDLAGKPVAVEVNRQLVPRREHADRQLGEGDQIEVVTLVGGG